MFTHSSHSTPTPSRITASTAGGKQDEQMMRPTKTATQSTSVVRKPTHDTLERVATPPPRTRTKTKCLASEEAQQAIKSKGKATKQSKVASKKAINKTHSQRILNLKTHEVSLHGFHVPLFFFF
jgi:hypothetical protein